MSKVWRYYPDECDFCGDGAEIFTWYSCDEGEGFDGDEVRCVGCGATGHFTVYDEGDCYVNWNKGGTVSQ